MKRINPSRPVDRSVVVGLIVAVGLWVLYFLLAFHPIWDVDVFWHIKAGSWIVEHLSLPTRDIFSAVDPERPWQTFQWLYEVLVYGVDAWAGLTGLRVVHAVVTASVLVLCLGWFWQRRSFAHGLLAMGLLAVMFADRMRVRPDVFNLLFVAVLFPVLMKRERLGRTDLITVLVLSGVWANVHAGGALLAPILLGARIGGRVMELLLSVPNPGRLPRTAWKEKVGWDLVVLGSCVVLMLLMPGFLGGNIQAFTQLGPSEKFIPEWMSTYEFLFKHASTPHELVAGWAPLAGLCVLLVYTLARAWIADWSFQVFPWLGLCLTMPMVYLSLEHVRFVWLGFMPWAVMLCEFDAGVLKQVGMRVGALCLIGLLGLLCIGADVHYHLYERNPGLVAYVENLALDLEPGEFPEGAGDFLAAAGLKGRILNHASWGGYLLYRLWPDCLLYTDGRGNFTALETHILVTLEMAGIRRDAINAAYGRTRFEMVVHPDPFPVYDYSRWDWVLIYRDQMGSVYLRNARRNQANFDRVVGAYGALGANLNLNYRNGEVFEFERRVRQFWGHRRLEEPGLALRVEELSAKSQAGDVEQRKKALLGLAVLYFDAGLYVQAREFMAGLFALESQRNPRAQLLYALAFLADGYPLDALLILKVMENQLMQDPGLRSQLKGQSRVLFQLVFSHLVEYAMTVPYNRYKWNLDGGKWQEWR